MKNQKFMKLWMMLIGLILISTTALAEVKITEVLYDPISSETGGEFVELFNPTDKIINLSGWALATKSSVTDVVIEQGMFIRPQSYFLIADSGWETKKDDESWPGADVSEAFTLGNQDAGVSLRNATSIIDSVGWGDAPEGFFETNSTLFSDSGTSMKRIYLNGSYQDSNNNFNDFLISQNTYPHNSSFNLINTKGIVMTLTVNKAILQFYSIILPDDDPFDPGFQISPIPGSMKNFTLEVITNSLADNLTVSLENESFFISDYIFVNESQKKYSVSLSNAYYKSPGSYGINITAYGDLVSNHTIVSYTYLPMTAMAIDASSLGIGNVTPGEEILILGDNNTETDSKPTIFNIGNTPLDIAIKATSLSSSLSSISLSNIYYNITGSFTPLSLDQSIQDLNLDLQTKIPLSFRLSIPLTAESGEYQNAITINAISS